MNDYANMSRLVQRVVLVIVFECLMQSANISVVLRSYPLTG